MENASVFGERLYAIVSILICCPNIRTHRQVWSSSTIIVCIRKLSLTLRNRETGGVKEKSDVWCEPWASAEIFPGGQGWQFSDRFQIADDTM